MANEPTPAEDDERRKALIAAIEARMRQVETFAWNVPALVIAAQAFLLTIGLDRQASPHEKEVAAVAGIVILIPAVHFMWKHKFNFDVYEAVIERQNRALHRYSVAMSELIESLKEDPPTNLERWDSWPAKLLIRNRRTVTVWSLAFAALFAIDVAILVHAAT